MRVSRYDCDNSNCCDSMPNSLFFLKAKNLFLIAFLPKFSSTSFIEIIFEGSITDVIEVSCDILVFHSGNPVKTNENSISSSFNKFENA